MGVKQEIVEALKGDLAIKKTLWPFENKKAVPRLELGRTSRIIHCSETSARNF